MNGPNSVIPFNKPYLTGNEHIYITQALACGKLAGDGPFTKLCHDWLELHSGAHKVLLTHSCTTALEMTGLLLEIGAGDEVILPSYTFVSTANAFVMRGGIPVFVDIRSDTLNIDETLIEDAITSRTRAIVVVHYAGVSCDMDSIITIAERHGIAVIEDAAQGVMATYKDRPLGSIGHMGTYSFHETKNLISGEGGALLVSDARFAQPAEIIREKGTDRGRFFRGEVDKYTWQSIGSSYLPGEMTAAFLYAQLQHADVITRSRLECWDYYHDLLAPMEIDGYLRRPIVPHCSKHNAHMYYVLLKDEVERQLIIDDLKGDGISTVFHYVPLHSSPAGQRFGRSHGSMEVTDRQSARLLRLPLWYGLTQGEQDRVGEALKRSIIRARLPVSQ